MRVRERDTHTYTNTNTNTNTNTHTRKHKHTHTHANTQTHTHTQTGAAFDLERDGGSGLAVALDLFQQEAPRFVAIVKGFKGHRGLLDLPKPVEVLCGTHMHTCTHAHMHISCNAGGGVFFVFCGVTRKPKHRPAHSLSIDKPVSTSRFWP